MCPLVAKLKRFYEFSLRLGERRKYLLSYIRVRGYTHSDRHTLTTLTHSPTHRKHARPRSQSFVHSYIPSYAGTPHSLTHSLATNYFADNQTTSLLTTSLATSLTTYYLLTNYSLTHSLTLVHRGSCCYSNREGADG